MRDYEHTAYPPATRQQIADVEQRLGVVFCDDFKAFLEIDNGLDIDERVSAEDSDRWIDEVHTIFGISGQQPFTMEAELDGFFDRRFLPICYPVGVDGGGNPLLQIAAGSRRGHLAMLDHEVWHGGMRALLDVEDGFYPEDDDDAQPLPFETFDKATPDQILDECLKQGFLAHYPVTLDEHLRHIDALMSRVAQRRREQPAPLVPPKAQLDEAFLCQGIDGKWVPIEKLSTFQGERFLFIAGEGLAWTYETTMDTTRDLRVRRRLSGPDGRVLSDDVTTIESNATYRTTTALTGDGGEAPPSGTYTVAIDFPDDPALGRIEDSRELLIVDERPRGFTCAQFRPADEVRIAAAEAQLGFRFCDDFRRWIAGENGIRFQWPHIKLWNDLDDDDEAALKADVEAAQQRHWELAVHGLLGLQGPWRIWSEYDTPPRWIEAKRGIDEVVDRESRPLQLRALHPVAESYAEHGQGFGQIVQGSRRGRIVEFVVSSFHLEVLEHVADHQRTVRVEVPPAEGSKRRRTKNVTLKYPFADAGAATPDQLVDAWIAEGMIRLTDMTFEHFAARVIDAHEREFARLCAKVLGGEASPA